MARILSISTLNLRGCDADVAASSVNIGSGSTTVGCTVGLPVGGVVGWVVGGVVGIGVSIACDDDVLDAGMTAVDVGVDCCVDVGVDCCVVVAVDVGVVGSTHPRQLIGQLKKISARVHTSCPIVTPVQLGLSSPQVSRITTYIKNKILIKPTCSARPVAPMYTTKYCIRQCV